MTANDDFDFSVDTVPRQWTEAAEAASTAPENLLPSNRRKAKTMPSRQKANFSSAGFLGLAIAIASGIGWYYLETGIYEGELWWGPAAVGFLISIGIRVGGGSAAPGQSFAVSTVLWCLTVLAIGTLIARSDLKALLSVVSRETLERQLIANQFSEFMSWMGLVGAIAAITLTSFAGGKRS